MESPAVTIRAAGPADLDGMVGLLWDVAAEGRWIGAEVPFDREARRARYAELVDSPAGVALVAGPSGDDTTPVVGLVTVSVAPYGVGDLTMLVADRWRARGVGRALLGAAAVAARAAGAHKLWLEVWPHNEAAIGLYLRSGFVEEGRKRAHYRRRDGELWDAVLMGRRLD